jgi:hypothetical protein
MQYLLLQLRNFAVTRSEVQRKISTVLLHNFTPIAFLPSPLLTPALKFILIHVEEHSNLSLPERRREFENIAFNYPQTIGSSTSAPVSSSSAFLAFPSSLPPFFVSRW